MSNFDVLVGYIDELYYVRARCRNCGHEGEASFKKGERIKTTKCPRCGCLDFVPLGTINSTRSVVSW